MGPGPTCSCHSIAPLEQLTLQSWPPCVAASTHLGSPLETERAANTRPGSTAPAAPRPAHHHARAQAPTAASPPLK
jgi:hypothetical protein